MPRYRVSTWQVVVLAIAGLFLFIIVTRGFFKKESGSGQFLYLVSKKELNDPVLVYKVVRVSKGLQSVVDLSRAESALKNNPPVEQSSSIQEGELLYKQGSAFGLTGRSVRFILVDKKLSEEEIVKFESELKQDTQAMVQNSNPGN